MGIIKGNGERMIVYTKDLSPKVRNVMITLISQAAYQLEKWSESEQFLEMTNSERITSMCRMGIEGIVNLLN